MAPCVLTTPSTYRLATLCHAFPRLLCLLVIVMKIDVLISTIELKRTHFYLWSMFQRLTKITIPWTTHTFFNDKDSFQDLIHICYAYQDGKKMLSSKQQLTQPMTKLEF